MATRKENHAKKRAALLAARDRHGRVRPELLVKQARHPKHPFHKSFVWSDAKAAELQRLETARGIIKSFKLMVVIDDVRITAPFYVSDPSVRDSAYIESTAVAKKDHTARVTLLDELSRIKSAIIRARSLAAVFKLSSHFERLLRAVVEVEGKLESVSTKKKAA